MCGRYALALPPAVIRQRLRDHGMPMEEDTDDDDNRETYNFAPGYFGLVYRADTPDSGSSQDRSQQDGERQADIRESDVSNREEARESTEPRYKLQSMKWGLVPFWTKRNPDYGTLMRTINCRDDSLAQKGGMWQTMKQRKRCIVIAQGFYEWLKKNDGKEKIPHYIKRRDGQLMCMAGLWDCVKYEDAQSKLYTYAIITTDANKQVSAIHDRMPVILESGSKEMFKWLDSKRTEWGSDLQSLLQPYKGELEIYPVSKEVGKVGNNSPNFIIPVNSKENKNNIANFFGNQNKAAEGVTKSTKTPVKDEEQLTHGPEKQEFKSSEADDSNAPNSEFALKRERSESNDPFSPGTPPSKVQKVESISVQTPRRSTKGATEDEVESKRWLAKASPIKSSPIKSTPVKSSPVKASPVKASPGNAKITSFFGK